MPINNLNNITNNTFMKAAPSVNANLQNNMINDNNQCITCSINPKELFNNTNLNMVKYVHSENSSSSLKKESFGNDGKLQNKNSSNDNIFFIDNSEQSKKKVSHKKG